MALGPELAIAAPQSGVSAQGLLRAALVLTHPNVSSAEDLQARITEGAPLDDSQQAPTPSLDASWGNGIRFSPMGCADANVINPCATTPAGMSNDRNRPTVRNYFPFAVDAYDACSTFGYLANEYEARARQLLSARESKAVEKEFWTGAIMPANPHLADDAVASGVNGGEVPTTVGTGLSPHNGLSLLVQALADENGGAGMLHMRPRLLEILVGQGHLRFLNGLWYTARGVVVVAGDGYPGTGPAGEAVTSTTEWAFATDLVEVHRSDPFIPAPPNTYQTVAHRTNDESVRAQRLYAPIWNGCALAAASITIPATDAA